MANYYTIPLRASPQIFPCTLSGRLVRLTFTYQAAAQAGWTLDIDEADGSPIVDGTPIILGADMLSPYRDIFGVDAALVLQNEGPTDDAPAFDNLASAFTLFFANAITITDPWQRAPLSDAVAAVINPKPST